MEYTEGKTQILNCEENILDALLMQQVERIGSL